MAASSEWYPTCETGLQRRGPLYLQLGCFLVSSGDRRCVQVCAARVHAPATTAHMPAMGDDGTQLVEAKLEKLDLHKSSIEELQLARVVTRTPQVLSLVNYSSDNDESDPDEEDGRLHTTREFHENGNVKHSQTFQYCKTRLGKPYKRVVEEKHFDTDGVCRLDVHFAIGSPYLSRKHYYATQTLKSESLFWVDDE